MPATPFTPTFHGFRFPNRFEDIVVTDPSGNRYVVVGLGRYGVMTYAALDFFNARIPIPPTPRVPYGLALGDYIWERQTHAVMDSLDKWLIMPANSQQQLIAKGNSPMSEVSHLTGQLHRAGKLSI